MITHGWYDGYFDDSWLEEAKEIFKTNTDYNFIAVDWRRGAGLANYNQAASNAQVVGREIANIYNELILNGGFRPSNFYCTGHSLGAHVCSYAGRES